MLDPRGALAAVLSRLPPFRGKGRLTLMLDRLLTDPGDPSSYVVRGPLNGDGVFEFDLRPWGQKFAFYYRTWERDHLDTLRSLYRGGVFIDVGSSLGLYCVGMATVVRRHGGSILAIEPVAVNLQRQHVNLVLNGIEDLVTVLPIAVGAEPGELRMHADPARSDNNAFIVKDGELVVPVRRLDDVLTDLGRPEVTMIKIDVEGFEPAVLEGARQTIETMRPIIFAEFNRERMAINGFVIDDSWDFLVRCGYSVHRLEGRSLVRIDQPGEHENLFFLPPSAL